MSQKLRTTAPTTREQLVPRAPDRKEVRKQDKQQKQSEERAFNDRHRAQDLPELSAGDKVWVRYRASEAVFQEEINPRLYEVETADGATYRRNCRDMVRLPDQ